MGRTDTVSDANRAAVNDLLEAAEAREDVWTNLRAPASGRLRSLWSILRAR